MSSFLSRNCLWCRGFEEPTLSSQDSGSALMKISVFANTPLFRNLLECRGEVSPYLPAQSSWVSKPLPGIQLGLPEAAIFLYHPGKLCHQPAGRCGDGTASSVWGPENDESGWERLEEVMGIHVLILRRRRSLSYPLGFYSDTQSKKASHPAMPELLVG